MDSLVSLPADPADRECVITHNMRTQRVIESPAYPPTEQELRAFMKENADRFRSDPTFTFRHVYLSADRRPNVAADARALLERLQTDESAAAEGDRLACQVTVGTAKAAMKKIGIPGNEIVSGMMRWSRSIKVTTIRATTPFTMVS